MNYSQSYLQTKVLNSHDHLMNISHTLFSHTHTHTHTHTYTHTFSLTLSLPKYSLCANLVIIELLEDSVVLCFLCVSFFYLVFLISIYFIFCVAYCCMCNKYVDKSQLDKVLIHCLFDYSRH